VVGELVADHVFFPVDSWTTPGMQVTAVAATWENLEHAIPNQKNHQIQPTDCSSIKQSTQQRGKRRDQTQV
jgi:hypothetical protein